MKNQSLKVKYIKINGFSLLNIRLWCYSLAFIHLMVVGAVTLNIDLTGDEDPMVRLYSRVRWKLLTCWFNLISLVYLPLCLYCDWCEKRGDESPHVEQLRKLRDVVMTAILLPITIFCDVMFWVLFRTYPNIIAPPRLFEYMPLWAQHSLHTISMVTAIMDLLLTPRRRPDTMKTRLAVVMGFATVYCLVVYESLLNGEPVYAWLTTASNSLLVAVYFSFLAVLTVFYYAQWHLIEYVWGYEGIKLSAKSAKIK